MIISVFPIVHNIQKNAQVLTYLLTYLLTPRSRVLLEKPTVFQLVKKFPALYSQPSRSSPYPHIPLPEDPS